MSRRGHDAKKGEVWNDAIDKFILAEEHLRVAAGHDDHREGSIGFRVLFDKAPDEPSYAVVDTLEHRFRCRLSILALRRGRKLDLWKCFREVVKGAELHSCSRCDRSTMEGAASIDEINRDCRACINDDAGLLDGIEGSGGVQQAVNSRDRLGIQVFGDGYGEIIADTVDLFG